MTAIESLLIVALSAALGWGAARVVVWSIDRLVQRRRALDGAHGQRDAGNHRGRGDTGAIERAK